MIKQRKKIRLVERVDMVAGPAANGPEIGTRGTAPRPLPLPRPLVGADAITYNQKCLKGSITVAGSVAALSTCGFLQRQRHQLAEYGSAFFLPTTFGVNFVFTFPPLVRPLDDGRFASLPSPGASLSPLGFLLTGLKAFAGDCDC